MRVVAIFNQIMKKILVILSFCLLTACEQAEDDSLSQDNLPDAAVCPIDEECDGEEEITKIANPASVFCEENAGELKMLESEIGTTGICIFDDGSQCEEWEFYRGECQPGESLLDSENKK